MGQAGRGIFQCHGPCQPDAFLGAYVRCHTYPADGGALGDIVHDQDCTQPDRGFVHMDDFQRAQFVGELKGINH